MRDQSFAAPFAEEAFFADGFDLAAIAAPDGLAALDDPPARELLAPSVVPDFAALLAPFPVALLDVFAVAASAVLLAVRPPDAPFVAFAPLSFALAGASAAAAFAVLRPPTPDDADRARAVVFDAGGASLEVSAETNLLKRLCSPPAVVS